METIKGNTFKAKRETCQVPQAVKDNLKAYNSIRRKIVEAFGNEEMTIPQLAEKTGISKEDAVYFTMSLLKFGQLETVRLDDMDEYYFYKIRK